MKTAHAHSCIECKRSFTLFYSDEDAARCRGGGELIQSAMPYLNDDERELLISGVCGECFVTIFNGKWE